MRTLIKRNRKLMRLFAVSFFMLLLLPGCKTKQPVVTNDYSVTTNTIEKDKLTPVAIPGENAQLRAQFECDSLNRVLLKNFNELKSKNMASSLSFENGQLNYGTQTKPDTVFIPSTDHWYYLNRNITKTLTITKTVVVDKPVRGFIWWLGLITWITIILFLIFKVVTKTSIISKIKQLLKIN